jgi:hypothetical protein
MATTIIPAGQTRPVRIPKETQIDIVEHPTGTQGYILLNETVPPERINYPLTIHPHPTVYSFPNDTCLITNVAPPGSSVDILTQVLPVTEV